VLNAMMSVLSGGMRIGATPELHDVLGALRAWQPDSPLADVCEARLLINQTEWREAANLLRHVTSRHANLPVVSALYALCLYMQHDDEWRHAATDRRYEQRHGHRHRRALPERAGRRFAERSRF
jgi:type III secretion protein HrpB1